MIGGVHALIHTEQPDVVRAFFRDVVRLAAVDAGEGWLIFSLPPAELAVHRAEGARRHELYLMCDDIGRSIAEFDEKGIRCSPLEDRGWGLVTSVQLPGGDELGLYEPRHETAIALTKPRPVNEG